MRDVLQVQPLPDFEPAIGRWLWALESVRRRTVCLAADLDQDVLDWRGPEGDENSIGSLLYHIALIEMSWLYLDILEQEIHPSVRQDFPFEASDPAGRLTHVPLISAVEHVSRLDRCRRHFLRELRGISAETWTRLRSPADVPYQVTPEWAVFHLVEHEAGHAFQIGALRARAIRYFGNHSWLGVDA